MNSDVASITDFWYNRSPKDWFMPPEGFDQDCHQRFGPLVKAARASELDSWATDSPQSALALLILLDQIPRNVFRGTAAAFSSDPKAHDVATKAIARGWDKEVTYHQALTFYLPLMHGENLLSQVAAVALCENVMMRCPEGSEEKKFYQGGLMQAYEHRDTILKFGRYPGRNKALGRESTEEEKLLLEQGDGKGYVKVDEKA
jgi:uncharacterized protein (DUF924 family)